MTKADKLRELFPDFVSHVDIDLNESGSKRVVFLNVPSNTISISHTFPASCGCCMDCEIEDATLDCVEEGVNEFDDTEFEILIKGLTEKRLWEKLNIKK